MARPRRPFNELGTERLLQRMEDMTPDEVHTQECSQCGRITTRGTNSAGECWTCAPPVKPLSPDERAALFALDGFLRSL